MLSPSLDPSPLANRAGGLVVITGPSGVGKGTLLRSLLERHPEIFFSISVTTRAPRSGEVHGKNYHFVTLAEFEQLKTNQQLLEWAEFAGNFYGTPRQPIAEQIAKGNLAILEIELQGARQVKTSYPEAKQIFILPPSFAELERRIRDRAQDSETAISRRLAVAQEEIAAATEFDVQIINDDLGTALSQLEATLFGSS
jgi:guanylate kinase